MVWRDNRNSASRPWTARPDRTGPRSRTPDGCLRRGGEPHGAAQQQRVPLATQLVHVGTPPLVTPDNFGWLMMDLWHRDSTHAQGWVGVMMSADGRYSISNAALRADDLCNFGL